MSHCGFLRSFSEDQNHPELLLKTELPRLVPGEPSSCGAGVGGGGEQVGAQKLAFYEVLS